NGDLGGHTLAVDRGSSTSYNRCGRGIFSSDVENDRTYVGDLRTDIQAQRHVNVLCRRHRNASTTRTRLDRSDRDLGRALDLGVLQVQRGYTRSRDYLGLALLLTGGDQCTDLSRAEDTCCQADDSVWNVREKIFIRSLSWQGGGEFLTR